MKHNVFESVVLCAPKPNKSVLVPEGRDEVCMYEEMFRAGLRLPIPSQVREVLFVPAQLNLNGWRILIRGVKEAKLPVSSFGLGSIKLGSCTTWLLNEPSVDMKL